MKRQTVSQRQSAYCGWCCRWSFRVLVRAWGPGMVWSCEGCGNQEPT